MEKYFNRERRQSKKRKSKTQWREIESLDLTKGRKETSKIKANYSIRKEKVNWWIESKLLRENKINLEGKIAWVQG